MSEDEFGDNGHTVEYVAREMLHRYGPEAAREARERAEIADGLGDTLSAEAWRDIADAAERILRAS